MLKDNKLELRQKWVVSYSKKELKNKIGTKNKTAL
jgi:hypothetical protein